jgi:hypothetical protein
VYLTNGGLVRDEGSINSNMTLEHVSKSASIGVPKGNAWMILVVPSRYCPRISRWVIHAPALGPGEEMIVNDKD